ncbi:hypothetical protein A4A49_07963, partial [Nicotiana attenuata]
MPRMEVIRKSFITQTEVRGGVKIAHFNAKTVYIDLDNEYDHSTVWSKQYMYIQGQMMRIEAWNPIFKPNEDYPIVPVWIMIPELPWHLYYMEIMSPLLSPVGKALFLDLASFQKTRGSVAKVKMQVYLTKDMPTHVWLGYGEDQDVNGDGQWLEVQYENLPSYCLHCRHLGHSMQACPVKQKEFEVQKKKEEDSSAAKPSQATNDQNDKPRTEQHQKQAEHQSVVTGIKEEEWKTQKKKNFKGNTNSKKQQQVYVPKQAIVQQYLQRFSTKNNNPQGFPHVQHECANAQLATHSLDLKGPTTSSLVPENTNDQQSHEGDGYEVSSSEEDLMAQQSAELRKLSKGKAQVTSDFFLQPLRSKNKPSKKKRQAMRKKNSGISINEPSKQYQSPVTVSKRPSDSNSNAKSQAYKDRSFDPSVSQPLLNTNAHTTDTENDTIGIAHQDPSNVLAATSMEECPQNKNSPLSDEYRPILSEDEMSGGLKEDNEVNEASDDDQHYDMLVNAVNGEYQQSEAIGAQGLSPRSYNLSPRLTRIELRHVEAVETILLTIVYAQCKPGLRRPLWDYLRTRAASSNSPWCVIGDFNVKASIEEKIGGIPYEVNKSLDFLSMIEDCGLTDLGLYGPRYTWSNGRGPCSIVWKRLDRGMVNDNWIASYPATTITHLASTGSDHSPPLMEMHVRPDNATRYFKFLNRWTENQSFLPLVQQVCKMQVCGNPMWIFHQKIKGLCSALSKWSRQEYGDIFHKAKEFEEKARKVGEIWAQSNREEDREIAHELNAKY